MTQLGVPVSKAEGVLPWLLPLFFGMLRRLGTCSSCDVDHETTEAKKKHDYSEAHEQKFLCVQRAYFDILKISVLVLLDYVP
jgi:hypothetical protein